MNTIYNSKEETGGSAGFIKQQRIITNNQALIDKINEVLLQIQESGADDNQRGKKASSASIVIQNQEG
jgi:hypothetical protein